MISICYMMPEKSVNFSVPLLPSKANSHIAVDDFLLFCLFWALPQVLALCHIAVGQQMNLHWLHKVRAASTGTQGGGERLEAIAAEEGPGHIFPPLDHGYNCSRS